MLFLFLFFLNLGCSILNVVAPGADALNYWASGFGAMSAINLLVNYLGNLE